MEMDLAKACATAHFCGSLIETSGMFMGLFGVFQRM